MKISDFFDKIYVINLLERDDRRKKMYEQFVAMGLFDELNNGKIEFIESVKLPCFNENIVKAFNDNKSGYFFSNATNTFNVGLCLCTFEHYKAVKRALIHGYKRILVLEDDACFLKNTDEIIRALKNMPEDFDILHLEGYYSPSETEPPFKDECLSILSEKVEDAYWEHSYRLKMFGAAALIYSENGMKRYIENQETYMIYSDYYTYMMDKDSYFYTFPLVIQENGNYSNICNVNNFLFDYNIYDAKTKKEYYY